MNTEGNVIKFSEWYILLMSDQPDLTVVRHFGILSHIHIADSTIQLKGVS